MTPLFTVALAAWIITNLADVYTTVKALATGKAKEANPLMAWLIDKIGIAPTMLVIKAGLVAGVALIAMAIAEADPVTGAGLLGVGSVVIGAVAVRNYTILRKMGG